MGRKPSRWTNLPKGMRARARGKKVHYYLDTGGKPRKEIPLGSDYIAAIQKWAALTESMRHPLAQYTFVDLAREYRAKVLPTKAPRTQRDNEKELAWLLRFFGDPPAPLDGIEPIHIRQYMDWRVVETRKAAAEKNAERKKKGLPEEEIPARAGHVRANREKSLFSHMWNFAREQGKTAATNPCSGVRSYKESGRDTVIEAHAMQRVLEHAGGPLRFALLLARHTGQRPADVLKMSESHIAGGFLHVTQGKTAAKLRIELTGALAALIEEIRAYKSQFKTYAMQLLVNEKGQPLTNAMFRTRFDAARDAAGIDKDAFQFRDLRATAATAVDDDAGIRQAQALLGHTTEGMTAEYVRHKVGKRVKPAM